MSTTIQTDVPDVAQLNARIDRLPQWGLSSFSYFTMGIGWFFVFYDITVIGFTLPALIQQFHLTGADIALPVSANLFAYVIGAYVLGSAAEYMGRRRALQIALAIAGVGAILTGLSWDLASLTVFRGLTGLGMGAYISLATTMLTELSAAKNRGRNVAYNMVLGALGLGGAGFIVLPLVAIGPIGWRVAFMVGALVLLLLPFMRDPWFPESPRWLVLHGRGKDAEDLVSRMEDTVQRRTQQPLPTVVSVPAEQKMTEFPTWTLLRPPYLSRTIMVFLFWVIFYVWIYAYLSFGPTILIKAGLSTPHGLLFVAIGDGALPVGAVLAALLTDRIDRKYLIGIALAVSLVGFAVLSLMGSTEATVVIGGGLIALGDLLGVGAAYTYTAEVFPTRARASGMAIGDGLGHLGGAIQPFIVLAALAALGARPTLWILGAFTLADMVLILGAGMRTTGRHLTNLAQ